MTPSRVSTSERARLGVLPGDPADLHDRHRRGVRQHDRHLQQHPQLVADVVGGHAVERLGAVAALEQERLAARDRGDLGLEVVALAGEHQRRQRPQPRDGRVDGRRVGVRRLLGRLRARAGRPGRDRSPAQTTARSGVTPPRWSMSRNPVFFARMPRLVSQVSAQSTMPSASSPPAILYWILWPRVRAHGPAGRRRRSHRGPAATVGRPEVVVVDVVAAQDEHATLTIVNTQSSSRAVVPRAGRATTVLSALGGPRDDQAERQHGGEGDGGPRRPPVRAAPCRATGAARPAWPCRRAAGSPSAC